MQPHGLSMTPVSIEEYEPKIVYIKGIHNTVAGAVLQLEYDPIVNQTAESLYMTKSRTQKAVRDTTG
jgi:hypothetical protein